MAVSAGGTAKITGWSDRVIAVALLAGCLTAVHAAFIDPFRLAVAGDAAAHLGGVGMRNLLDIMAVNALQRVVDRLPEGTGVKKQ